MTALVIFTNQMLRRRADCPPPSGVCGATAREARRRGGDAFARLDACAAGAGTPLLDSTPAPPGRGRLCSTRRLRRRGGDAFSRLDACAAVDIARRSGD